MAAFDILGLCTSLVPFGNHLLSTRLNAGSKNQKHALGFYAANYQVRMDMDVNLLETPQMPITQTVMHNISDYAKHPSGQNLTVAIMSNDVTFKVTGTGEAELYGNGTYMLSNSSTDEEGIWIPSIFDMK